MSCKNYFFWVKAWNIFFIIFCFGKFRTLPNFSKNKKIIEIFNFSSLTKWVFFESRKLEPMKKITKSRKKGLCHLIWLSTKNECFSALCRRRASRSPGHLPLPLIGSSTHLGSPPVRECARHGDAEHHDGRSALYSFWWQGQWSCDENGNYLNVNFKREGNWRILKWTTTCKH